jgi:hypothetical protein
MTPAHAKELLPLITAYAEGKTIQFYDELKGWEDKPDLYFSEPAKNYRIKPEPKLVPMTHEDLPAVFWIKEKGLTHMQLVTTIYSNGMLETEKETISCEELPNWEWSPDRKTWHSFMKEEQA